MGRFYENSATNYFNIAEIENQIDGVIYWYIPVTNQTCIIIVK